MDTTGAANSVVPGRPGEACNARVRQRQDVSDELMILRVAPDGWELPPFIPGQFAVLGLPQAAPRCELSDTDPEVASRDPSALIRRSYSIASSSLEREYLEFYVTLVRSGELTPRLFALREGDPLFLGRKITGLFHIDHVPEDRHVVMIATGTGLAPYMSMLRSRLACGGPRQFAVLLGARHSWDLGYHGELATIARECPNVTYLPVISRPSAEPVPWGGRTGYVQDLWTAGDLERAWGFRPTPENSHVFLCGNPAMIAEATQRLARAGYTEHNRRNPGGQLHTEKYW